jgi:hypothetical protein
MTTMRMRMTMTMMTMKPCPPKKKPSSPVTHMAPIVKTAPIKLAWKTTSACDAGFGTSKNRRSCDG